MLAARLVNQGSRWLSDVVTSALVGYAVGGTLVDLCRYPDVKILP